MSNALRPKSNLYRLIMSPLLSFLRKEFLHIVRDRRTMLILLVMPVVMILLFGYAVTTEVRGVRMAVVDPSRDVLTTGLVHRLTSNERFSLVLNAQNVQEVETAFRRGEIDVALVFTSRMASELRPGGTAALQVLLDGSEPNQASVRLSYVLGVLATSMPAEMQPPIALTTRMLFNPQGRSEFNFVPAVMGMILILICAMMAAVSLVREKELGTMEVLLSSPLSSWVVVLGKLVPYFLLSCINLATILLLSVFLIGVPIASHLGVFLGICLLYILVSLALGLLVSTLAKTQLVAMMVSLLFVVPTIYLSGMAFPIESMPQVLQGLSVVVPARWFVDAARKLMIQGVEARYVVREAAVLVVMLGGILVVAVRNYKLRLE